MPIDLSFGPVFLLGDKQLINRAFWCTLLLSLAYYCLSALVGKCVQHHLRQQQRRRRSSNRPSNHAYPDPNPNPSESPSSSSSSVQPHKWRPTIRCVWSICFYAVATLFLLYYHAHVVQPEVQKADGRYFPQYENLLFFNGGGESRSDFNNIFVVVFAFQVLGLALQVREGEITDAVTSLLFTTLLGCLYDLRLEHYFLSLHIIHGVYQALTNSLFLVALHTNPWHGHGPLIFNVCAILHFASWSFVFLTQIPFNYLLPTLYLKPLNLWLNVFCWLWYGSCVWNSPVLQVLYHQSFHTLDTEVCLGQGSVAPCLLLKETKETRHLKWLKRSLEEFKESQLLERGAGRGFLGGSGEDVGERDSVENQSAKALQTLKCVMTLKRKLRRIRESKAAEGLVGAAAAAAAEDEDDNGTSSRAIECNGQKVAAAGGSESVPSDDQTEALIAGGGC